MNAPLPDLESSCDLLFHASRLHASFACFPQVLLRSGVQEVQLRFPSVSLYALGLFVAFHERAVGWNNMLNGYCREVHGIGTIPRTHEFAQNGVCVDWHGASLNNAGKRKVSCHLAPVARSIDNVENLVPCG